MSSIRPLPTAPAESSNKSISLCPRGHHAASWRARSQDLDRKVWGLYTMRACTSFVVSANDCSIRLPPYCPSRIIKQINFIILKRASRGLMESSKPSLDRKMRSLDLRRKGMSSICPLPTAPAESSNKSISSFQISREAAWDQAMMGSRRCSTD